MRRVQDLHFGAQILHPAGVPAALGDRDSGAISAKTAPGSTLRHHGTILARWGGNGQHPTRREKIWSAR